jgi:hypothetical protein
LYKSSIGTLQIDGRKDLFGFSGISKESVYPTKGGVVKTLILITLVLFISVAPAVADTYVKQETHTDSYYYGGTVTPEENETTEIWLTDKKMAFTGGNRHIVIDLEKNILIFANMIDSSYAETTLPMEWPNLLDEQAAARVQMFPTDGTIEETSETQEFNDKMCKCYSMSSWIPYEGVKYNERDTKLWVTTDAPFDASAYDDVLKHLLKLQNFNDEFASVAAKVKGFPLHQESVIIMKGFTVNSYEKVVEITEKEPPSDVYSAPPGFSKKDKLSMQDIQG